MFASATAARASAEQTAKPKANGEHAGARPIRSNQALLRELSPPVPPLVQRKCPPGRCNDDVRVQTKLEIGAADDPLEHEADRVAERVMRSPDPQASIAPAITRLQRTCGECAEDDAQGAAPPVVHDVLASPGRPLDAETRAFFEPRFARDLGDVRVHDDGAAAASANAVGALAYTAGRDIAFGNGSYAPRTHAGRTLLAHELTHVVQQSGGAPHGAGVQRQRLQRVTHGPTTPTNCHNWTIPMPPWIAGSIAHSQISAELGILPHAIPRATKAGGLLTNVPNPPAVTPLGFADLWQRGGAVNVAEIKSTATGGTQAATEARHYVLRHGEWLTRQTAGSGDATDATYFAAVGGLLGGGLLDLSSATGTDRNLGTFAGDPGKQLHIEADPLGAMVYWCTGAGVPGPLALEAVRRALQALKEKLDALKPRLQQAAELAARALAAVARFVARLLIALLVILLVLVMIALLVVIIVCAVASTVTAGVAALCSAAGLATEASAFAALALLVGIVLHGFPEKSANLYRASHPSAADATAASGADYDRDQPPAASLAAATSAGSAYNPGDEFTAALTPANTITDDPVGAATALGTSLASLPSTAVPTLTGAAGALEQGGDTATAAFVRTTIQNANLSSPAATAALSPSGAPDTAVAAADTGEAAADTGAAAANA